MQAVSDSYNPCHDERWSNVRVVFELIDIDAAEDATPTVTSEAEISKLEQTHNRITEVSKKLATLEHNYFLLDGTHVLPDETDNGEAGWWSDEISDSNGNLLQILEFNFTEDQSSIGFTIIFDDRADEYALDFKIEIFDALNSLLSEDNVVGNTKHTYISETPTDGYRKVRITFTKTKPYRRVRVCEVVFGIIQTFDKTNTTDVRLLYELSPNMENLPSNELTVTIENLDRKYNLINPKGIYKYLQQGQGLNVELGVGSKRDNIEYADMGRFYFTQATAEDSAMTAQIVAHDPIYALDRGLYRKGLNTTDTVGNIVNDIIADSGLGMSVSMPTDIANRVIGRNTPIVSHREALRMVAQASMCCCYWDRTDTLVFAELTETEPTDTLDNDNMYTPARVEVTEYINVAEVTYYSFRDPDLTDDEIYKDIIPINGTKAIWVTYDAAKSVKSTIEGGTIDSAEYYLYACKLTITAAENVTLTLTGRSLEVSEGTYRAEQLDGNPESVKRVDNPLITSTTAPTFASWILANEQKRLTYDLQERGNPAREIGDTVKIYDAYNENRNAIITKEEYLFDGTLKANTEAWGGGI